jgi:hypothetical protein
VRAYLGIVLHHAFEAGRLLEGRLLGIGVLGVDELRHDSRGRVQVAGVRIHAEDELVDVAWVRALACTIQ